MQLAEQYEEVLRLLNTSDDESEPYKSKYAAREVLQEMKSFLASHIDREICDTEQFVDDDSVLSAQYCAVLVHLGIISLETEELSTGQEYLDKASDILSKDELLKSSLFVYCGVLCQNHLAVLWSQRGEQEKANDHLRKAKEFYLQYRNQSQACTPKALHELFYITSQEPGGWDALEKLHTLTLYYLAQVLQKLGKANESAELCLQTLHRQLNHDDFVCNGWAINAANLARFYQINRKYKLSRRLLAAAATMMNSSEDVSENIETAADKTDEVKSEISRRFGSYCVALLEQSAAEFEGNSCTNEDGSEQEDSSSSEEACLERMEFCKLELTSVEESVPCKLATNFAEARLIFMAGLRWLNESRNYFTLEDFASSHTDITREMSSLYKLLSIFDSSADRRSKMHKRRVDLLTPLLDVLSRKFYLQVCRQLDYELGETYSAMVDCKYELRDPRSVNLEAHHINKINSLVKSGIRHFESYLNSFIETGRDEPPKKYPSESERPVLVAYFYLGRLWSKLLSSYASERINYSTKSLRSYEFLVNYCEENQHCKEVMSGELPACQEMVRLLPFKIHRMQHGNC